MGTTGFILNVLIFAGAGYVVWRMKPKNPKDAALMFFGWALGFLLIRFAIGTWIPRLFISTQQETVANWDPVYDQAAGAVEGAGQLANSLIGLGGSPVFPEASDPVITAPDYIPDQPAVIVAVEDGSGEGSPAAVTAVSPLLAQTAVPETAVTESLTVTATQKMALYADLTSAAQLGDRAAGRAAVASLLALDPLDAMATQAQTDLEAASLRFSQWQALANIPMSVFIDKANDAYVRQVLAGYSYVVIDSGATWNNVACQERATVQVVSEGWLWGAEFQVLRCYLSQFRVKDSGDRFTVR